MCYCWWSLNRCEIGTIVHTAFMLFLFLGPLFFVFVFPSLEFSVAGWRSFNLALPFLNCENGDFLFLWEIYVFFVIWGIDKLAPFSSYVFSPLYDRAKSSHDELLHKWRVCQFLNLTMSSTLWVTMTIHRLRAPRFVFVTGGETCNWLSLQKWNSTATNVGFISKGKFGAVEQGCPSRIIGRALKILSLLAALCVSWEYWSPKFMETACPQRF